MNSKSNLQLDILIKRIYSSYIDIKSGEFNEIDKDILLADISQLYISIKELYPNHENQINDLEKEILFEKSQKQTKIESKVDDTNRIILAEPISENKIEENITDTIEPITSVKEKINIIEPKIISTENEFDLTMFMDNDEFNTITSHPFADKRVETTTLIENTKENDTKHDPTIEQLNSKNTIKETTPLVQIQEPIAETKSIIEINQIETQADNEYKSAGKIMDFLHAGEQKSNKDIYSYLDINTRIGLVEMFFKGNSLELTEALVKINKMSSKEDCIAIINNYATQFDIKETDDIYQTFIHLINRKFSGL